MVCLSDEGTIQATVRDMIRASVSTKKTSLLQLYPEKPVESIFTEITNDFHYDIDTIELTLQNNRSAETIILNRYKNRTLREAGVSFEASSCTTIIITPLKTKSLTLHVQGCNNYEDDLLLGASASPTTGEAPSSSIDPQPAMMSITDYYSSSRSHGSKDTCNYVGLVNQAMTCYLNSLLQALYMTPEFRNALYNWEFDGSNPSNSIPFQLQRLFLNLQTSAKPSVETTDLTHSFGWNMQQAWEQHDIQELCRVMFDALEQKFKDTKQSNLINDLYEGKMLDYVKCLECSTEKSREDTFQDIPLPVRPFGSSVAYNSVEEALRAFVQPETLDGQNQYHCEKCNKKCDAHKGLKFTKFPYLLTLHLKRFDFDYSTMNRIKLNDKVVFPEKLNLNSFILGAHAMGEDAMDERETVVKCDDSSTTDSGSALDDESCQGTESSSNVNGPDDNCQDDDEGIDVSSGTNHHENEKNRLQEPKGPYIYELFSIMIHSGSASGGHYYAYIKDFSKNQWFCFNDQSVSIVTEDDIHKTYGGGPQRGYYSGAYTSSTNAYMLMYRQIDKERNCEALTLDDFPSHIKTLLQDMQQKEESDRIKKEKETDCFRIKFYCQHPKQIQMLEEKQIAFPETILKDMVYDAHKCFKLKDVVRIEDCRLVAYNKMQEIIECSLDDECTFGSIANLYSEFLLEIKKPDAVFEDYKVGGVSMKVYLIDMESEEVEGPCNIWVNEGETVYELKKRLASTFKLETVHIVQETYSNQPRYLEQNEALVKFDPKCNGYKLYVSNALDLEDPDKPFIVSKLATVIDRFVHIIMLEIALPDTDAETLYQLSIPSLDLNQNLDRIEVGAGDRTSNSSSLRVSPQPSPGNCELFGDQSNSEDSSLSDSDRTLVGDAPGDNIGMLSTCSSNSPGDQHMASPSEISDDDRRLIAYYDNYKPQEEMNWDDEEPSASGGVVERASLFYYFKAQLPDVQSDMPDSKCCRVLVDKRMNLGKLKKNLEPYVGVPMEYFKVYRQYPNQDMEWPSLTDTLSCIKDGQRLIIKLGRVLKSHELSGKIYFLALNTAEPVNFWFEWIIAKEQTVESVKREILLQAKKQYMVDLPMNKCILRKKNLKNPSRIFMDDQKFSDDIPISNNFELFVQEAPEKENTSQLFIFLRKWYPTTLVLSNICEISIENRKVEDLKNAISNFSNIEIENLEIACVKCSFPADMNVLQIHNKLEWNPEVDLLENYPLQVYEDGSIFFYRDKRDALKELTMEEKKELNQSENKRLGRYCASTYSPRRERGLKIYVDTSPKKEDEVFLD